MKGTVRVIAGSLKGKAIPFNNNGFGQADITPQKVKGAIFSILGDHLDGAVFLDLYSGSGQAGIEAISRGCSLVIFNESDRRRYSFITAFLGLCCGPEKYIALNTKAISALGILHKKGIVADIVFLDPPYDRTTGGGEIYSMLLEALSKSGVVNDESVVIIQHFGKNILPRNAGGFVKRFTRVYGTTSLSVYDAESLSQSPGDGDVGES